MKKVLSVLLVLVMLLTVAPLGVAADVIILPGVTPESETALGASSGTTGSCRWELSEYGVLTISGKGEMADYCWGEYAPWGNEIIALTIENGVTSIGDYAFYECDKLSSVIIPDTVTSIGEAAFYWCMNINAVSIPDSVRTIGDTAFYSCDRLTKLTIGSGVTTIGEKAFYDCDRLAAVTLPDNVTKMGSWAFYHCDRLAEAAIGSGITTVSDSAFGQCKSLRSVDLGPQIKTIGWGAFQGCLGLTSVTVPDNVKTLEQYAFYGSTALTEVKLGSGVTEIGTRAFTGCYLTDITVAENNPAYCAEEDVLFTKDKTTLVQYPGGREGAYVIPDTVTVIGDSAFESAVALPAITIPATVAVIGDAAFAECDKLSAVTIPNSVKTLGASAFYRCAALTSMPIPDSVTAIGQYAFYQCTSLTDVILPYTITTLEEGVFSACSALTQITIPDTVTAIKGDAFQGCTALTAVVIPEGVTAIGDYAFGDCAGLATLVLPATVKSVGDRAFFRCYGLAELWYGGTEKTQQQKLSVGVQNQPLLAARWRYSVEETVTAVPNCQQGGESVFTDPADGTTLTVTFPANGRHAYAPACGLTCQRCGYTRLERVHVYDNACDSKCNVCSATRRVGDHKWKNGKCTVCGKASPSKVKITAQSATARYAKTGATVSAKVTAKGDGLKYQWYVKNAGGTKYSKSAITKATYAVTMTSKVKGRRVYCVVTDQYGNKVQSKTFILRESVSIATQPKTTTVKKNVTAKATVKAKGDGLKYTWYLKNEGAKKYTKSAIIKATYSVKMTAKVKNRLLYCVVTDRYGNKVQTKTVRLKMK